MSPTEQKIIDYAETITKPESDILKRVFRETNLKVMNPIMLSGHLQGKLLQFLSTMIKPRYVLEIGTYTGYSAICLAQGLQKNGKLISIESNPELEDICRKNIADAKLGKSVELIIGDAKEIIPGLEKMFDLVYIDCDKEIYLDIYEMVFDKVAPGGFIIADNVLWHGKILDENEQTYKGTKEIAAFNEFVKNDERADNMLLPFRDGLMLIRKY